MRHPRSLCLSLFGPILFVLREQLTSTTYPQLVQKWQDELVAPDPSGQPLVNVTGWISRTTLDIMGQGETTFFRPFLTGIAAD
jgi:hypothetical protein